MSRFVLGRVAVTLPTALLVVVIVFSMLHLTPGDPALLIAGEGASPEIVDQVRHELGLDQPLPEQLVRYVGRLVQLDLGRSLHSKAPVRDQLAERLPNTLVLAATALAIAALVGVALGLFTALRYASRWDVTGLGLATIFVSAPTFWVGMLLIQLFAVTLGWLPPAGIGGPEYIILPALALAAHPLSLIARLVRSETLETLADDYVRTARSKGLRERTVIVRHVFRNTLLPVVTIVGLQIGVAFNGAVVTEAVFAWPGVGRLLVEAILTRDYPVVQGGLLVVALGFLVTNLVVDLLYGYLDPRIRFA